MTPPEPAVVWLSKKTPVYRYVIACVPSNWFICPACAAFCAVAPSHTGVAMSRTHRQTDLNDKRLYGAHAQSGRECPMVNHCARAGYDSGVGERAGFCDSPGRGRAGEVKQPRRIRRDVR